MGSGYDCVGPELHGAPPLLQPSHDWVDGRWWRVICAAERVQQPESARTQLWCETSNEDEARSALKECPYPAARLERHQKCEAERWVEAPPTPTSPPKQPKHL
jgi:hypothetical protein